MLKEILVIDDNPDIRFLICNILKEQNFQVRSAANYDQAVLEINKRLPDLAIIDIKLDKPDKDGIDATDHDASNVYHVPLEVSEAELPIRFNRMELWMDSGGAGKWRGGLGFYSEVEWLKGKAGASLRRDRHKFKPWGLAGGHSGPECSTALKRKHSKSKAIPGKSQIELNVGDILQLWTTGSGGHSNPLLRDPLLVLEDFLDKKISKKSVLNTYGVVIQNKTLDTAATKAKRKKLKNKVA